jgi:hypothetical protein
MESAEWGGDTHLDSPAVNSARHLGALALAVESPAVVWALYLAVLHRPQGEGARAVGAFVVDASCRARLVSEKHPSLAHQFYGHQHVGLELR